MRRDKDHTEAHVESVADGENGEGAVPNGAPRQAHTAMGAQSGTDTEADILRSELATLNEKLAVVSADSAAANERYLRSRAEFDTYRRRMVEELSLAREAGLDSALLPVLNVFDDLGRALQAAEAAAEPSGIVTGIRAVHENLLRSIEVLGVRQVGHVGEPFDPELHEAVAALPPTSQDQAGTIRDVHRAGFAKGERVIRPATVTVYQE